MTPQLAVRPDWVAEPGRKAFIVGVVGLLASLIGAFVDPDHFFRSYLIAYVFWVGIPIGCLAVVMLHHMTGGGWGIVIRRILESGTRTLPVMAALFLPLLFGLDRIYLWAQPDKVASDPALQHKSLYLNIPFFVGRAAFYFAAWCALAWILNRWSRQQDARPGEDFARRFELVSAPGLLLLVLTVTFASVDWFMSLEPHWFSTIYGAQMVVGQLLSAFAFVVAVLIWLAQREPLAGVLSRVHLHDLGKLLFAFVMLWAYLALSQFLIIWSGNLPEEIPWYMKRTAGGWQYVALAVVIFHFALPFLLLLPQSGKNKGRRLVKVAALVVFMRLVDTFWMAAPAFKETLADLHWLDLTAAVGLGGVWMGLFARELRKMPLLPIGDPSLMEAITHEH